MCYYIGSRNELVTSANTVRKTSIAHLMPSNTGGCKSPKTSLGLARIYTRACIVFCRAGWVCAIMMSNYVVEKSQRKNQNVSCIEEVRAVSGRLIRKAILPPGALGMSRAWATLVRIYVVIYGSCHYQRPKGCPVSWATLCGRVSV